MHLSHFATISISLCARLVSFFCKLMLFCKIFSGTLPNKLAASNTRLVVVTDIFLTDHCCWIERKFLCMHSNFSLWSLSCDGRAATLFSSPKASLIFYQYFLTPRKESLNFQAIAHWENLLLLNSLIIFFSQGSDGYNPKLYNQIKNGYKLSLLGGYWQKLLS